MIDIFHSGLSVLPSAIYHINRKSGVGLKATKNAAAELTRQEKLAKMLRDAQMQEVHKMGSVP